MPTTRVLNLTRLGWGLAIPVLFLGLIGLASIHATDRNPAVLAETRTSPPTAATADPNWLQRAHDALGPRTTRQILYFLTGVALLLAALVPSYQRIGRYAYFAYGVTLVLLILLVLDRYIDLPLIRLC